MVFLKRFLILSLFITLGPFSESFANFPALVIVDMQESFAEGRQDYPQNMESLSRVIARQIELIEMAKANGLPIVIIEYHGHSQTFLHLLEAIGDYPDVKTFKKNRNGAFDFYSLVGLRLTLHLRQKAVTDLILAGANAHACAKCSIEGALKRNFKVWADATALISFQPEIFMTPYTYDLQYLNVDYQLYTNFYQAKDIELEERLFEKGLITEIPRYDIKNTIKTCRALFL